MKASFFFLQLKYNSSTQQKCVNFLNIEVFINENVKIFAICNKAFYIAFFKELVKKTLAMVMLIKNNKSIDFFRETGKTTIALGANKDGEVEIVVKDAGKHLVSFLTTAGNKLTQEIDVVTGKLKEIIGQMNEKDIRDSLKKTSSASAKAKSSASKKIIRSSSSTKVNTKYPSSIHGRWEVTKEVYIHKITNRDLCYKTFGGDGDDSFAKEECRDYEKEDDYCVGNAMNVYSDGTIDYLAGKKQTSFHYTYDKTKGILSYTDVDGETYSIQASSNGKTMIMETVTDADYMKITHRLTFTKITDDIE